MNNKGNLKARPPSGDAGGKGGYQPLNEGYTPVSEQRGYQPGGPRAGSGLPKPPAGGSGQSGGSSQSEKPAQGSGKR